MRLYCGNRVMYRRLKKEGYIVSPEEWIDTVMEGSD